MAEEAPAAPAILIVDDKSVIRNIVRLHLETAGFRVYEAGSGAEALSAARSLPIKFVFLDVMMPVMDGMQTARGIRQIPGHENTPIVMLTSRGTKNDVVEAIQAGANDYVVKPFTRQILLEKAKKFLGELPKEPSKAAFILRAARDAAEKAKAKEKPPAPPPLAPPAPPTPPPQK